MSDSSQADLRSQADLVLKQIHHFLLFSTVQKIWNSWRVNAPVCVLVLFKTPGAIPPEFSLSYFFRFTAGFRENNSAGIWRIYLTFRSVFFAIHHCNLVWVSLALAYSITTPPPRHWHQVHSEAYTWHPSRHVCQIHYIAGCVYTVRNVSWLSEVCRDSDKTISGSLPTEFIREL